MCHCDEADDEDRELLWVMWDRRQSRWQCRTHEWWTGIIINVGASLGFPKLFSYKFCWVRFKNQEMEMKMEKTRSVASIYSCTDVSAPLQITLTITMMMMMMMMMIDSGEDQPDPCVQSVTLYNPPKNKRPRARRVGMNKWTPRHIIKSIYWNI